MERDRVINRDIDSVRRLMCEGALRAAAESVTGPLK
jgi:hypothetical protein